MSSVTTVMEEYPGFGRCIYCGSDGGEAGLRDEHIVPFSLGGNSIIAEGSCAGCEAITSYLDGYLGQHVFYDHRLHFEMQTRRKKERPKTLPTPLSFKDEGHIFDLPVTGRPFATVMPVWGLPGILAGEQPRRGFPVYESVAQGFMPKGLRSRLELDPDGEKFKVKMGGTLNFTTFARAITRIAYCSAVAQFGLTGFRRLVLPDIILGRYRYISYFVGADTNDPPPPTQGYDHRIAFHVITIGRLKLMIISVRLFANLGNEEHGFPIYRVVTGAPIDSASMAAMKAIGRERVSLADI